MGTSKARSYAGGKKTVLQTTKEKTWASGGEEPYLAPCIWGGTTRRRDYSMGERAKRNHC